MILLPKNTPAPNFEEDILIFNAPEFWKRFADDLRAAQKSILIIAPYIRTNRINSAFHIFEQISKNVRVRVVTKDPATQQPDQCKIEIERLRSLDWQFLFFPMFHQKLAVIDDSIAWSGSLNILSHGDDSEQMHRFTDAKFVRAIIEHIDREILMNTDSTPLELPLDATQKECRLCGDKAELFAFSDEKTQLRCSKYPECRYRAFLSTPGSYNQSWFVCEDMAAYGWDECNAS